MALVARRSLQNHPTQSVVTLPFEQAHANQFSWFQRMRTNVVQVFAKPKTSPKRPLFDPQQLHEQDHPLFTTIVLTSLIASYLLGFKECKYQISHLFSYDPELTLQFSLSNRRSLTIKDVIYFQKETLLSTYHRLDFVRNCPHLIHFDLCGFGYLEGETLNVHNLVKLTDLSPHLESIKLNVFADEDIPSLAKRFPSLTEINLPSSSDAFISLLNGKVVKKTITDLGIRALAQTYPNLTAITIPYGRRISNVSLKVLGRHCKDLTSVNCENTNLPMDSLIHLAAQNRALQSITLTQNYSNEELENLAENCPRLTSIDLFRNIWLTDVGLEALSRHCPHLQIINLNQCSDISDHGIEILAQHCPQLNSIDLSQCSQITDKGINALSTHCAHLSFLSLSLCKEISKSAFKALIEKSTKLKAADCSYTSITDVELEILSQNCPFLTSLELVGCNISKQGLEILAQGCSRLIEVQVSGCSKISQADIKGLNAQYSVLFTRYE